MSPIVKLKDLWINEEMADDLDISFLTFILEGSQKNVEVKCLNRSP